MAIAIWEPDRTDHRHHAGRGATAPVLRAPARAAATAAGAPPNTTGSRAATRPGVPARVRRRLVGLALLVIVAVLQVGLGAQRADGAAEPGTPAEIVVVVQPGQTVWGLTRPHAPAGADAGVFAVRVLERNGLDATAVRAGTVVRIPAE
jgi:hypothetical protein